MTHCKNCPFEGGTSVVVLKCFSFIYLSVVCYNVATFIVARFLFVIFFNKRIKLGKIDVNCLRCPVEWVVIALVG